MFLSCKQFGRVSLDRCVSSSHAAHCFTSQSSPIDGLRRPADARLSFSELTHPLAVADTEHIPRGDLDEIRTGRVAAMRRSMESLQMCVCFIVCCCDDVVTVIIKGLENRTPFKSYFS